MQGSGISGVDVGSVTIRVMDDGSYNMLLGCADMGTGCDTILAQMAADMLDCPLENIAVFSADTDLSPYDSGSYASSTTYITGMACVKCCKELIGKIIAAAADMLGKPAAGLEFDGEKVFATDDPAQSVSLKEISYHAQCGNSSPLEATASHSSPTSPPPFMCGAAEVDIDRRPARSRLSNLTRRSTAAPSSTKISPVYRPRAAFCRASGWRRSKTSSMTARDGW